jgi:hypothetical protein
MVHSIENSSPSPADGELQMIASQVKFASISRPPFLLFGSCNRRLGRVIAVLFCLYILRRPDSVVPVESARLYPGRTIFFVLPFVLSAILFFRGRRQTTEPLADERGNRAQPANIIAIAGRALFAPRGSTTCSLWGRGGPDRNDFTYSAIAPDPP